MNNMILIFNRKVIPIHGPEKGAARVETMIAGFVDGEPYEIGMIKFPTKQSWTKFWGAVQRGAVNIPEFEVKMQNVMPDEPGNQQSDELQENEHLIPEEELLNTPQKKWVGNQLVDVEEKK